MRLIIVRHGEAENTLGLDSERKLTHRGENETLSIAKWLKKENHDNQLVLVSPFVRATQTFKAMLAAGYASENVVEVKELEPEVDPMTAEIVIRAYGMKADNILVISHLPLVSYLVEQFTKESGPIFATAAAAIIDLDDWQTVGNLVDFKAPFQVMD